MKTAYINLPDDPHYRKAAFITGFMRLDYQIETNEPKTPLNQGDVAVTWNRLARSKQTIQMTKAGGAPLLIAENGYYGQDADKLPPYALALDGHNGSGRWFVDGRERFEALNIEFKPWRKIGSRIALVADQRGIGSPQMASPHDFSNRAAAIAMRCGFKVRQRAHPGKSAPTVSLDDDLKDVAALMVWSSNSATKALIEGIPTYYMAPHIVTQHAMPKIGNGAPLQNLDTWDRDRGFIEMSWAQAFLDEIRSGEAMQRLIDVHDGRLPSCQQGLGI